MSSKTIHKGSDVRLDITFTPADADTVPAQVTLKITPPGGATVTYTSATIVNVSTNRYRLDYPTTVVGLHYYRWASLGAVNHAVEGQFTVERSSF